MIEESATETKPKKSFLKRLLKWLVILVIIIVICGFIGFKYSLVSVDQFKSWLSGVKIAENQPVNKPFEITAPDAIPRPPVAVENQINDPMPVATAENVAFNNHGEIAVLKENQKYFALYLAARDLRDAKNNPDKFNAEYRYFTVIAADNSEIAGKIDMLRLSVEGGMPTIAQLRNSLTDLATEVEKEKQRGLWESIKYSLGNLVRVTKVKGESGDASVYEIKTRATLALNEGDLNTAIREVQKLGPQSDEWVRSANNLARVYEITDYLVDYARNKIKF